MKKLFLPLTVIILLSSCAIFRKKEEKLGCPNDARGKSQDQIVSDSNKKKYKGGKKF
jgi:uncharacterized protein YceK